VADAGVVRVEVAKGVMTATLTDSENRNALGLELIQGLRDAVAAANADPAIRALVVTNEGNVFCAGANLKQQSKSASKAESKTNGKSQGKRSTSGGLEDLLAEIQTSPTPVIGRIAGHVVGGGNGLASALDISIASEDAKFGFTEVRLGVAPAIISVVCLPKMRPGEAMEAFLRGNRFPAARAAELGLINRAVPADQLDAAVEEVLADLRKGGPNALGFAKRLVYEVPRMSQQDAFPWAAKLSGQLFASEEAAEGMKAFLGKRSAAWATEED
jgi:methylglutaconyl-CoA hydratase